MEAWVTFEAYMHNHRSQRPRLGDLVVCGLADFQMRAGSVQRPHANVLIRVLPPSFVALTCCLQE